MQTELKERERGQLIVSLTGSLPVLRAAIGISQAELAEYIGISRQTYCALEQGKRMMSWTVFLSLFLFFLSNSESNSIMRNKKGFISQVYQHLQFSTTEKLLQYPSGVENINK